MTFAHPYLLLLLLLLPLAAWLMGRRGKPPAFVYSSVQLLRGVQDVTKSNAGGFLTALRWLALALFIIALSQPRLTKFDTPKATASGVDIVVAFDLSGSMAAEDFEIKGERVNRVKMAKSVLEKFIAKRSSDRIGLVAFGTQAFIASPITLDHDFLLKNLERMDLNTINGNFRLVHTGSPDGVADDAAREITNTLEIKNAIKTEFGSTVFDGEILNRQKLADVVFSNPEKLIALNAIIHPAVRNHFKEWISITAIAGTSPTTTML